MHLLKYTHGWTRRHFMGQVAKGIVAAGVLAPLFDVMANHGEIARAYPDELLSIEAYTRGRLKAGDTLSAENVDLVKELLDPGTYIEIKEDQRIVHLRETTTDVYKLNPKPYLDATFRNHGLARFDSNGIVVTKDGKPWIGGNPFPDAKTAQELAAGASMSWGRWDTTFYPVGHYLTDPEGNVLYYYEFVWTEVQMTGRVEVEPIPSVPGQTDKLRYVAIFVLSPTDFHGTNILQVWQYDARQFPLFYGFLPQFHRTRSFPSTQRFEPIVPGSNLFFTDTWFVGDPYATWGNFKLVAKGPILAAVANNWNGDRPNWEAPRCGGKKGNKYYICDYELVPEALVFEMEPVKYPRAPYSKKRIYSDARTGQPTNMIAYDRAGKPWKAWEQTYGIYEKNGLRVPATGPYPYWSWQQAHMLDLQSRIAGSFTHLPSLGAGWPDHYNDPKAMEFCTVEALARYGEA